MTTVQDIVTYVETLTGHRLNADEGIRYGPSTREISGATVCWMATPTAIHACGSKRHDLLIGHESLFYPYNAPDAPNLPADWANWPTNRQRRETLDAYGLTFLRLHGSVDEISIFDEFARMLKLGSPVFSEGLVKVYEITPRPMGDLVEHVKECLGVPHVRVSLAQGIDQVVHRVGLPWGGLGLFVNVSYQQKLIAQGCDVFISGESDNYGFRFAQELGIPTIETSHEVSEDPGLRRFTELLSSAFPEVTFEFLETPCVWQVI